MTREADLLATLRLLGTPRIGPKSFYKLVQETGSVEAALSFVEKDKKYSLLSFQKAREELIKAQDLGIHLVLYTDDIYPQSLRELPDAPPLLYVKGKPEVLRYQQALAVVGSRAASVNGRKLAARLSKDLTESGVCIVSGMARGIDTAAGAKK